MNILAFCAESYDVWQIVGKVLFVFKIVIPLLLIIFGMIDLGKAVISSDEKAISKSTQSIIRRLIAAVVIFFIPTIVGAIFNLISDWGDTKATGGYEICSNCLVHPYSNDKCKTAAKKACTTSKGAYYGANGKPIEGKNPQKKFNEQCPEKAK